MSDIHLNRAGQNLGIFAEKDVQEGINTGRFLGTDLGWRSGMENWKPLSQWTELSIPLSPISTPPPMTPDTVAVAVSQDMPSWETRDTVGIFHAFASTIKEVLLEPSATFSRMRQTGGILTPYFFMLAATLLGTGLALLIQVGIQGVIGSATALQNPDLQKMMALQGIGTGGAIVGLLVLLPIILFVGSFIGAGLWHLALLVLGGANKPFEATYRVYCYAKGSAAPLALVPCCGSLAVLVWGTISGAVGLSKVHQISTGKTVFAILLPLILCCSVIAVGGYAVVHALMNNPDFAAVIDTFRHR